VFDGRRGDLAVIFVFEEDGGVEVLEDHKRALAYEGLDVENMVFVFYGEDGTYLAPRFIRPNRRWLFGLVVSHGTYELVPTPRGDPVVDPFDVALGDAVFLKPNSHFRNLASLGEYVANRRSAAVARESGLQHGA
jgi:hypothetical protein